MSEQQDAEAHFVAETHDFDEDGARVKVDVAGREVAVFKIGGEYHAVLNYCSHQGGPLCDGPLTGYATSEGDRWVYDEERKLISCPWHAWKYDIVSGKNVQDESLRVPKYPTRVEDGDVYVLM